MRFCIRLDVSSSPLVMNEEIHHQGQNWRHDDIGVGCGGLAKLPCNDPLIKDKLSSHKQWFDDFGKMRVNKRAKPRAFGNNETEQLAGPFVLHHLLIGKQQE